MEDKTPDVEEKPEPKKHTAQAIVANIAAHGAVIRRGIGSLRAYGGKVSGKGKVIHKTGERAGTETHFVMGANFDEDEESSDEASKVSQE